MNNLGPKTEPCGTLHTMYNVDDLEQNFERAATQIGSEPQEDYSKQPELSLKPKQQQDVIDIVECRCQIE